MKATEEVVLPVNHSSDNINLLLDTPVQVKMEVIEEVNSSVVTDGGVTSLLDKPIKIEVTDEGNNCFVADTSLFDIPIKTEVTEEVTVEENDIKPFLNVPMEMQVTEEDSSNSVTPYDTVESLLEVPFKRRSESDRKNLLIVGRPTPRFALVKTYKNHNRSFRSSWYEQLKWLCGSYSKAKLFCWPCLLMGKTKSVWSDEGFDDLKNLSRASVRHASSKDHLNAHLFLNSLTKEVSGKSEFCNERNRLLTIKFNEEVTKNRNILKVLIDVTSLLFKQEIDFRVRDESEKSANQRNFKAIFDLVLSSNTVLKQQWDNLEIHGQSSDVTSIEAELIECFQDEITQFIFCELNQAPFFACIVDEVWNSSEKSQLSVLVRFVDCKGEIQEHFLGFYDVNEDKTADGVYSVFCKALENLNRPIQHKLVAHMFDGSVKADELQGLQEKVRQISPQAVLTPCFPQCLNTVLQQSCCTINPVKVFFCTLQGIPDFFRCSLKRIAVLVSVLGECIPTNSEMCWDPDSKTIRTIYTKRLKLIEVFKLIMNYSDPETAREAQGYVNSLGDFTFVFLLLVFQKVFEKTDSLLRTLKRTSYDEQFCTSSVYECMSFMKYLKGEHNYDKCILSAEVATGSSCLALNGHPVETSEEGPKHYYKQMYFDVLDNVIAQLEVRFSRCKELTFLMMGNVNNFSLFDKIFPSDAFTSLMNTYGGNFNKDKLRTELEIVYSPLHQNDDFHDLEINRLVKKMVEDGTNEILPEAYKLFTLIATISAPSRTTGTERSVSCYNRVKTYIRTCKTQDRIGASSLVSVEKNILKKLESRFSWHDDIIDSFAKKKDRGINLLYRLNDDVPQAL